MQSDPSASSAAVLTERNVGEDFSSLHRAALMNSASLIVIELENLWSWTITDVGLGARRFFRDALFSSIVGHILAHLMRCEDLPVRWNETCISRTWFIFHSEIISHWRMSHSSAWNSFTLKNESCPAQPWGMSQVPKHSLVTWTCIALLKCLLKHVAVMSPSSLSTPSEGRIHLIDFSAANSAPYPVDISAGSKYESFCNFNTGNDKDPACFLLATPTLSSYMLIQASMIPLHRSKIRHKKV